MVEQHRCVGTPAKMLVDVLLGADDANFFLFSKSRDEGGNPKVKSNNCKWLE